MNQYSIKKQKRFLSKFKLFKKVEAGKKGFSTIELMIAMSIMIMTLSAIILVSFGNQMSLAGSEANAEALKVAQKILEEQQAIARKDFNLVNATTTTDGFYTSKIEVEQQSDWFTKKVTAKVEWIGEKLIPRKVEFQTLLTDFESPAGGNTCNSSISGNWTNPKVDTYAMSAGDLLPVSMSGQYPITDIDAYRGKLYITVSPATLNTDKTFFIFDIGNPSTKPSYIGGTDNASSVKNGLNAVHVAGNYAYVANSNDPNFNTCTPGPSCSQLQIIDVSNPSSPSPTIVNLKLATSTGPKVTGNITPGSGQAVGKSIFYKDGYIYLGLSRTNSGPEFNIIDVRNSTTPFWVGSFPTPGTSSLQPVNSLFIKRGYGYLAHPTTSSNSPQEQLTILSVSDPRNPVRVSGWHASTNSGNGKSLKLVGDDLYLGRTISSGNPEMHVLDISNPTAVSAASLGNKEVGSSINDILVRDFLTFVLTNTELKILRTDNPVNVTDYSTAISLPSGSSGTALDCESNYVYVGSVSGSNGFLTILTGS